MKPLFLILTVLAAVVLVAGCGESSQEKAKKQVCSARADIQKQVAQLQGLTLATATTDTVKASLSAIRSDLNDIADAQGKLNSERKQQVKSANDEFVSQFKSIASDVGTSLSISGAKDKLRSAADQLAATYKSTFAKIDCGG